MLQQGAAEPEGGVLTAGFCTPAAAPAAAAAAAPAAAAARPAAAAGLSPPSRCVAPLMPVVLRSADAAFKLPAKRCSGRAASERGALPACCGWADALPRGAARLRPAAGAACGPWLWEDPPGTAPTLLLIPRVSVGFGGSWLRRSLMLPRPRCPWSACGGAGCGVVLQGRPTSCLCAGAEDRCLYLFQLADRR